jgi:hypothetical protein
MEHATILVCYVCGQTGIPADPDFCPAHARALDIVKQAYDVWAKALGSISLADFKRIGGLSGTGRNAREIAEFVLQHPERWK